MTKASNRAGAASDGGGSGMSAETELLRRIHRRFVPLHASLSDATTVSRSAHLRLIEEIGAMLADIEANDQVRTVVRDEGMHPELAAALDSASGRRDRNGPVSTA